MGTRGDGHFSRSKPRGVAVGGGEGGREVGGAVLSVVRSAYVTLLRRRLPFGVDSLLRVMSIIEFILKLYIIEASNSLLWMTLKFESSLFGEPLLLASSI